MVRPMKDRGVMEVRGALRRVRQLHALGRIGEQDFGHLEMHLERAEEIILGMTEYDAQGQEVIDG